MGKKLNIIGEIPARLGSERVHQKNLKNINGKPLISYAIEAAKSATMLTDFYVNSESEKIGDIALAHASKFYKRKKELASNNTKQDEFNYDFIKNTRADILVLINPVCPLIDSNDINNVIKSHIDNKNSVTVTCLRKQLHAFCNNNAINFSVDAMLPRTQDIDPIDVCTWSICAWDAHEFVQHYDENGHAVFFGKIGFYPIPFLKSIKISTEEDFILAEKIIKHNLI